MPRNPVYLVAAMGIFIALAASLLGCNAAPAPTPAASNEVRPKAYDTRERLDTQANNRSVDDSSRSSRRNRSRKHAAADGAAGEFDFYLLNLSWSPAFCATHPGSPECGAHPGFVVHGLWPQNTDGTYPENCSNAPGPANPSAYTDIIPTASLVEHEWATHGTCSGLAPDAYFGLIRRAFKSVRIPAELANPTQPTMLPPAAILDAFARINTGFPPTSFALSCGNNYLTAVEVCMDKNLHAEACQNVRSCRANVVKITPR